MDNNRYERVENLNPNAKHSLSLKTLTDSERTKLFYVVFFLNIFSLSFFLFYLMDLRRLVLLAHNDNSKIKLLDS